MPREARPRTDSLFGSRQDTGIVIPLATHNLALGVYRALQQAHHRKIPGRNPPDTARSRDDRFPSETVDTKIACGAALRTAGESAAGQWLPQGMSGKPPKVLDY